MIDTHRILLDQLVEWIFRAEIDKHKQELTLLVDENDKILRCRSNGFNHLGRTYGRNGMIVSVKSCSTLSLELVPDVSRLLQFKKQVDFDRQIIYQIMSKLMQPCQDGADIRDALPECVVQLYEWLVKTYPRTREPAYTIKDNIRDMQLYRKYLPKIETYCAMRMLY